MEEKLSDGLGRRRYDEPLASIVDGAVMRLTSVPMKEKGAQHANAHGIPQIDTSTVAMCSDRTNGARNMAPAKIMWLSIQAVSRSGFALDNRLARGAAAGDERGVKLRCRGFESLCGDWTTKGRRTEPMKVTMENMSRDRDPIRPMSPSGSFESAMEASGVYRK